MTELITFRDEAQYPIAELLLCHGAGAPADSPFMTALAKELAGNGINVTRFELAYMASRRFGGSKRPPPKVELLIQEWCSLLNGKAFELTPSLPLFIGGKSMGARLACMVTAEESDLNHHLTGVICYGYPFHPQKQPETLRLAPLENLANKKIPALIVQGTRDAFGTQPEVTNYPLSSNHTTHWLPSADHDFKPLKSSGLTQREMIKNAAHHTAQFIASRLR